MATDPVGSPYAWGEGDWVGYDNSQSALLKSNYIKTHQLGGAMVFAISFDDFRNDCSGGKNPLLSIISQTLNG